MECTLQYNSLHKLGNVGDETPPNQTSVHFSKRKKEKTIENINHLLS